MKERIFATIFAVLGIGFAQGPQQVVVCAAQDGVGRLDPFSNTVQSTTMDPPPPGTGLAGAWAFNEGAGSQTADASRNDNNGTLGGNTSWVSVGRQGSGLAFDGSGASVHVPNSRSLDIAGTQITVSFWARVDVTTQSEMVFLAKPWTAGARGSPRYQYGVEFDTQAKAADFYFGTNGGVSNGPFSIPLTTGTWTYIAFTYDGSFVLGYRDGTPVVRNNAGGSIVARGQALLLGVDPANAHGFKGRLDDVRIYSRALSAAEIQSDMNTGVGTAPDTTPPGTVLNLHRVDTLH